jgi:hypothetical protein
MKLKLRDKKKSNQEKDPKQKKIAIKRIEIKFDK